ncbi:MAG: hypothetical protein F4091_12025 [Acidimicrobiales bacterium]|nr:hypothetical protein [Acidimicrobiales bacterium]MYA26795.1 hypothetical protein [Acidimicrobiales bacterium]MYD83133.1 hypothetical protein [Acidimicrobiales bacterium]MYJ66172.1 hypothetical protein [Acidimicrobiales bacterium]
MAQPKSRHSGRVTPKGTRPSARGGKPQLSPQARYCLELMEASAIELAASGPDADEADRWASGVQDFVAFPKTPVGAQPPHVLDRARELGGPAGAVMTAALAAYGPSRHRNPACRQLEQMAAAGEAPPWATAVGSAAPVEALLWRDPWGEECAVTVIYERSDGSRHGLVVEIGWFMGGAACALDLVSEPDGLTSDDSGRTGVEPVSLADARALCLRALDVLTVLTAAEFDSGEALAVHEALDFEGMDMGFLVEQRLSLLPEGGSSEALFVSEPPDRSALLDEFIQTARPAREGDAEFSNMIAGLSLFGLLCRGGDVLHWTPCRVDTFVEDFIPGRSPADGPECLDCGEPHPDEYDPAFMSTVESAFGRWLRFAAEHCESSMDFLDENLHAATEAFGYWREQARKHRGGRQAVPDLWLPRAS